MLKSAILASAGCFLLAGQGYCQTGISEVPAPPAPPDYREFFSQMATLQTSKVVFRKEQTIIVAVALPTVQEALGLTDAEAATLRAIAVDCEDKLKKLPATGPLIFEARLRFIESGETVPELERRLKELDDQREQTVRDHVRLLQAALGDSRFELVDAFVRAKTPTAQVFPPKNDPAAVPRR